jgi:hypothetical protein
MLEMEEKSSETLLKKKLVETLEAEFVKLKEKDG